MERKPAPKSPAPRKQMVFITTLPRRLRRQQRALAYVEPTDKSYTVMHHVADGTRTEFATDLQQLFEAMRRVTDRKALVQAIQSRNPDAAAAVIPWQHATGKATDSLRTLYQRMLVHTGRGLAPSLSARLYGIHSAAELALRFAEEGTGKATVMGATMDLVNPRSLQWIQTRTGNLIQNITAQQVLAVRQVMQASFRDGIDVEDTADMLEDIVGLDNVRANALYNYWRGLSGGSLSNAAIGNLVENQWQAYIADRAMTIARTETIAASNQGQQELWNSAQDAGVFQTADVQPRKIWIVTPDDKLCEECAAMGEMSDVDVSGSFGDMDTPPLHPNCRCAMGLVVVNPDTGEEEETPE